LFLIRELLIRDDLIFLNLLLKSQKTARIEKATGYRYYWEWVFHKKTFRK